MDTHAIDALKCRLEALEKALGGVKALLADKSPPEPTQARFLGIVGGLHLLAAPPLPASAETPVTSSRPAVSRL